MKKSSGLNALLIELVIVLFFFILSFSVLAQVYAGAFVTEKKAAAQSRALYAAQNISARLQTGQSPEDAGAVETEGGWQVAEEGFSLFISQGREVAGEGVMEHYVVSARQGETEMFSLPVDVYRPEVNEHE